MLAVACAANRMLLPNTRPVASRRPGAASF